MTETFDYIIVGAGAAGSILADRLSVDGQNTVCVLEAGPKDSNPFIRMPAGYVKMLNDPAMMWQFKSEPSEGSAGRQVYLPQGRVAGGSTSINGLVYNRGQAADVDRWAAMGNEGWSYEDVLPYYRRSESRPQGDPTYRGQNGPIKVSDVDATDPVCDAFINSVASHGVPAHNDYNGASQRGAGYYQRFIHDTRRVTAASAFLNPALQRPNLQLRAAHRVLRLLQSGKRVTGVEVRPQRHGQPDGEAITLTARREVIVCAGTVNSARLLQVSGIGPGPLLQSLGVPVHHDLPGVGENFHDHYFVRLGFKLKPGTWSLNTQARGWRLGLQVLRWAMRKPSILSLSPSVAYAFVNSAELSANPDLQFVFAPGSYKPGQVYVLDDFPGATCGFTQQRPESIGTIRITSPDPMVDPAIQPNYLSAEEDKAVAIRGIRLARRFSQSAPLANLLEAELSPGPDVQTDDELLDFARQTGNTGYHLVGSCMMGPASNPMAVVGPDLKIHGLEGVRVIDASVMPFVPSANTCATTLMIAEKGADLVLSEQAVLVKAEAVLTPEPQF